MVSRSKIWVPTQSKDHNQLGIHLTVQALVCALKKDALVVGVFSGHCEILECLLTALVWRCAECEGCHYPAQL